MLGDWTVGALIARQCEPRDATRGRRIAIRDWRGLATGRAQPSSVEQKGADYGSAASHVRRKPALAFCNDWWWGWGSLALAYRSLPLADASCNAERQSQRRYNDNDLFHGNSHTVGILGIGKSRSDDPLVQKNHSYQQSGFRGAFRSQMGILGCIKALEKKAPVIKAFFHRTGWQKSAVCRLPEIR
jgi:hypothetical protein